MCNRVGTQGILVHKGRGPKDPRTKGEGTQGPPGPSYAGRMRRRRLYAALDGDWLKLDSLPNEAVLPDLAPWTLWTSRILSRRCRFTKFPVSGADFPSFLHPLGRGKCWLPAAGEKSWPCPRKHTQEGFLPKAESSSNNTFSCHFPTEPSAVAFSAFLHPAHWRWTVRGCSGDNSRHGSSDTLFVHPAAQFLSQFNPLETHVVMPPASVELSGAAAMCRGIGQCMKKDWTGPNMCIEHYSGCLSLSACPADVDPEASFPLLADGIVVVFTGCTGMIEAPLSPPFLSLEVSRKLQRSAV